MKKVNIIFGVLSTIFFMWHGFISCEYFLGNAPYTPVYKIMGSVLAVCVFVHMLINMISIIENSKRMKNYKFYSALISETMYQNITGFCILGFVCMHPLMIELDAALDYQIISILRCVFDNGLYVAVGAHLCFTLPHILISYGVITNKSIYCVIKSIIRIAVVCVVIFMILAHIKFCFFK